MSHESEWTIGLLIPEKEERESERESERERQTFNLQERKTKTQRIHTHAAMEENLFPVFHSEPSGENREEDTVNDSEERTSGQESRTESERQLDEGQERWRDEDGSLADDEDDDDDDDDGNRMSFAFTPLVQIVRTTAEKQTDCYDAGASDVRPSDVRPSDVRPSDVRASDVRPSDVRPSDVRPSDVRPSDVRPSDVSTYWESTRQSPRSCCGCCGEMMSSVVCFLVGVVMFPLLVWGGHDLLPLDLPVVRGAPSRLVYTLRCSLFATFPIILGVLVHGVSRLKFSSLNPLFEGKRASHYTLVHMTYVQDSLRLFLLFVVQLAVMSTYIHHDALKLVPLLTIIFVFGRLIYWPSVCFGSSVRVLGFSLSFLPILILMGLNLYFIFSSTGEGAVFDVAPPTTAPPPKARWWG